MGIPLEFLEQSESFKKNEQGIYPDNQKIVDVFIDMMTQWRPGTGGIIGLVYEALPVIWKARVIKRKQQGEILDGLQVMERAALEIFHKKG